MVFVTGGTGFIGTHLLRNLLGRSEKIRALKRHNSSTELEENLSRQIEWVTGNVLDVASLEEAMAGCEKVYHCAAVVSFLPRQRNTMMKVNVEGTANVVNVALEYKVKRFVYLSSVAALGKNTDSNLITEEDQWENAKNDSNYALSKHLAEREVWRGVAEGLTAVVVNPSLVIGTGNWNENTPRLFMDTWKGLPAYPSGVTGIICVEDVTALMVLLMESGIKNERFILSAENWKLKDFFFLICDLLGRKPPQLKAEPWITEIIWRLEAIKYHFFGIPPLISKETSRIASRQSYANNTKIVEATGYQFKAVKDCIREICMKFLESRSKGIATDAMR